MRLSLVVRSRTAASRCSACCYCSASLVHALRPRGLLDMAPSLGLPGPAYCSVCRLPFIHPASPVPRALKLDEDARAHLGSAAYLSIAEVSLRDVLPVAEGSSRGLLHR